MLNERLYVISDHSVPVAVCVGVTVSAAVLSLSFNVPVPLDVVMFTFTPLSICILNVCTGSSIVSFTVTTLIPVVRAAHGDIVHDPVLYV